MNAIFEQFSIRLGEFIRRHSSAPGPTLAGFARVADQEFNEPALTLFALQFDHVEPYRHLCNARHVSPANVTHWSQIPAVPVSAFKELELTSLSISQRTHIFHSSGTSGQKPSRHFHNAGSLLLYETSLLPWFREHLLPDALKFDFIILTPSPALAPRSSLVHMLETVRREFGFANSLFTGTMNDQGAWSLNIDAILAALRQSIKSARPIMLLGTAFSFVHLLDHLAETKTHFQLPSGSRVMETGGYKERSRSLPKQELHSLIGAYLGVNADGIVCEYGMSELSSQAYDRRVGSAERGTRNDAGAFRFPPWVRVQIISPETGNEVSDDDTGLIRVFDLANVRSVMAIQTEDLAVRRGAGFELLGRAVHAEPRGCSLMAA